MVQLIDESVFEISLDRDLNASFVPDCEPSERESLDASQQVAHQPDEPIEIKVLPDLPP